MRVIFGLHDWTPWSRILLEKLVVAQVINKSPVFYCIQRFIAMFLRACLLYLSWPRIIQSRHSHPIYLFKIHFNIILPSVHKSSNCSVSLKFPAYTLCAFLFSSMHATCCTHFILDLITWGMFGGGYQVQDPVTSSLLGPAIHEHPEPILPLTWQT